MGPQEIEPTPDFTITEMTIDDIEPATEMRLQSWLDTYVNESSGVTREWIEERNREAKSLDRQESRVKRFIQAKKDGTFNAWVAKDTQGDIIGSTTPFVDDEGRQHLGSLYVDKKWHGKGVASQLMQQVVDWFDSEEPIELMVATYNDRAKAFYRKWEFEEIPGSEEFFDDKIPEIKMVREAKI